MGGFERVYPALENFVPPCTKPLGTGAFDGEVANCGFRRVDLERMAPSLVERGLGDFRFASERFEFGNRDREAERSRNPDVIGRRLPAAGSEARGDGVPALGQGDGRRRAIVGQRANPFPSLEHFQSRARIRFVDEVDRPVMRPREFFRMAAKVVVIFRPSRPVRPKVEKNPVIVVSRRAHWLYPSDRAGNGDFGCGVRLVGGRNGKRVVELAGGDGNRFTKPGKVDGPARLGLARKEVFDLERDR